MKKIKAWFKNYWYYYKLPVLLVGFVIITLAILVPQLLNNIDYDINILYAGPHIFQIDEKEAMEDAFRQLMPRDYNGDGDKQVLIANMTIMTEEQMAEALEEANKSGVTLVLNQYSSVQMDKAFSQEIFAGESVICLLDPSKYEQVKKQSGFLPLKEALGYLPENAIDETSILFKDIEFADFFDVFDVLPDDTILCVRRISTASIFTGVKKVETAYGYHLDFFKTLLGFKG